MKKLFALLLAMIMCLSLFACGEDPEPTETKPAENQNAGSNSATENSTPENTTPEQTEPSESTEATSAPGLALSDDLADFTVSIDGTVYQFPCAAETFLNDDWQPKLKRVLEEDYLVEPGDAKNIDVYRTSKSDTICLQVYNPGNAACKVCECTVYGVQLYASNNVAVEFSGGLKLGDAITVDEMLSMDENFSYKDSGVVRYIITGKSYSFHITDGVLEICIINTTR